MTHVDLFSGIGGFALAAQWAGFRTVAFVEIEPYAQELLKQNFGAVADAERAKAIRHAGKESSEREPCGIDARCCGAAQLYADIRTFDGAAYRGATLLTGGFPCQPFSQAGKRRGKEDDRYLWPEMLRVIHEARPAWVLGENVAGIVTMELDRVLSDLEGEGYAVQALVIPACAVDAKHRRDRVWIVANSNGAGCSKQRRAEPIGAEHVAAECCCRWLTEPDVGRVANGVSARVDRLKGLGNAIVPQIAFEIIREIARLES